MAFGNELVITEESEVACRMGLACTGKERDIKKSWMHRGGVGEASSDSRGSPKITKEDHQ